MNVDQFYKFFRNKLEPILDKMSSKNDNVKGYLRCEIINNVDTFFDSTSLAAHLVSAQTKADKMELKRLTADVKSKQIRIDTLKRKYTSEDDLWDDGDNVMLSQTLDTIEETRSVGSPKGGSSLGRAKDTESSESDSTSQPNKKLLLDKQSNNDRVADTEPKLPLTPKDAISQEES